MPRDLRLSLCLSLCGSCTLLLPFLWEIGQEDEGRTERRGLCRKTRSSDNEEKEKEAMQEGGVADSTSYGKRAPCLLLMPRLCLRPCSFSISWVRTISDLSQGCQIFHASLLRCVLLWFMHKDAMQRDDVAALRERNLITVSETKTVPGNKQLTSSPALSTRGSSTNSFKREIQCYPEPRDKSTAQCCFSPASG